MSSTVSFICLLSLALLQEQTAAQDAFQRVAAEPLWKIIVAVLGAFATLLLSLKGVGEVALNFLKGRKGQRRSSADAAVVKLWKFSDEATKKEKAKSKYRLLLSGLITFLFPIFFAFAFIWFITKVENQLAETLFFIIWPFMLISYWIMGGVMINAFFVLLRLRPSHYKRVAHRAELIVEGEYERVVAQCKGSIKALGMKFYVVDLEQGLLKARKPYRWMRVLNYYGLGTHLRVRLAQQEGGKCRLSVRAGGIRSGIQMDKINNLTNLNRFIEPFMN
ncbi:MAG TPA: hypothetical protein VF525_07610 [Pyrinomonadaceae bacterium]|jgi:hypothetical protein